MCCTILPRRMEHRTDRSHPRRQVDKADTAGARTRRERNDGAATTDATRRPAGAASSTDSVCVDHYIGPWWRGGHGWHRLTGAALTSITTRPLPPGASSSLASAAVLTATTASPSYPPGASPWRTCRRGQRACQPARPTGYINRARGLDHSAPSSLGLRLRVAWARRGTAGGRRARGAAAGRRDDATGPAIYTR